MSPTTSTPAFLVGTSRKGPRQAADLNIRIILGTYSTPARAWFRQVQTHNVGVEILAIRALALVRAARLELVVSAASVIVLTESDVIRVRREQIARRPGRWRIFSRGRDKSVVVEGVQGKAAACALERDIRMRTVALSATFAPYWEPACCHNTVGDDKSVHLRIRTLVPQGSYAADGMTFAALAIMRYMVPSIALLLVLAGDASDVVARAVACWQVGQVATRLFYAVDQGGVTR